MSRTVTSIIMDHDREASDRASRWVTFAVVVGLILLGVMLRVLNQIPLDRIAVPLRRLLGESLRRRVLSPTTVARRIGVRSGMRVLVLAPDEGTTANAIAREVGTSGQVESVLSDGDRARKARELLADSGVTNVNVVTAPAQRVPYGDASFDAVCLLWAFDGSAKPREILAEVWRVLRPAGRLSASDTVSDPAFHLRRTIERWGEGAGFESLEYFGNILAYTVNFRKPLFA